MIRFFNVSIFGSPFVENRAAQKRNKKIGWSEWVVHLDCSLCFNFNFCAVSWINMESIQIICILYNTVKKNKIKIKIVPLNWIKKICHFVQKIISSIAQAHTQLASVFLINFTNLHIVLISRKCQKWAEM